MSDFKEILSRDIYFIDDRNKITMSVSKTPYGRYFLRLGKQFYSSFDDEWVFTKEGISIPYNIYTSATLFDSMVDILAIEEVKQYLKQLGDNSESNETAGS